MLLVGYCFGIRSERRLCEEVHLNLAYRWFCRLGLDGDVPDHSTFSKNRHGRFRDSDLLRELFETTVRRCIDRRARRRRRLRGRCQPDQGRREQAALRRSIRAGRLGRSRRDASLGARVSRHARRGGLGRGQRGRSRSSCRKSDPAAQWTGALKGHAFFAYATNYLIDLDHAVIVDVEASRAIRQAEVGAARTMIERTQDRFDLWPARLAADSAYGSAENLAWLVHERGIEPHIPVFDKSQRSDGTFSRSDFAYDHARDATPARPGRS